MVKMAAMSERGRHRTKNEDACCLKVASAPYGEAVMAVICDGVGGMSQGELASSTVVREFAAWFDEESQDFASSPDLHGRMEKTLASWERLLTKVNDSLRTYGGRASMTVATTFTGVFAYGGTYLVGQVGDSRLYVAGSHGFEQVTQDQTLVARMVERGELTPDEARNHPCQNVILQAVGAAEELCPVFATGSYSDDDLFVLCTDGVYKTIGTQRIADVFRLRGSDEDDALRAACKELIADAMTAGERDNLSICCFVPSPGFDSLAQEVTWADGDVSW